MLSGALRLAALALLTMLAGCAGFAPHRLYEDQLGYTRSLGDSGKAQTLLNIVRLRYGDSPVFLNTTQVISGYSLQQSFNGTLTLVPGGQNTIAGTPGITMTQSPTFTFQPVTGEALATSYLRPLSPAELLPLSLGGTPIDVLFRLAVQSVNGLENGTMLNKANRASSPGFDHLLVDLRRLQLAGLLDVHLESGTTPGDEKAAGADKPKVSGQLVMSIADSTDPALQGTVVTTRRLLGLAGGTDQAVVGYGTGRPEQGRVSLLTRSVLGMLGQVASEVQVPAEDVSAGRTIPTAQDAAVLGRPVVIVHSGDKPPKDAFSSARYRDRWYWIEDTDFDSKVAFSVMQMLLALAETNQQSNTVVTIPAR